MSCSVVWGLIVPLLWLFVVEFCARVWAKPKEACNVSNHVTRNDSLAVPLEADSAAPCCRDITSPDRRTPCVCACRNCSTPVDEVSYSNNNNKEVMNGGHVRNETSDAGAAEEANSVRTCCAPRIAIAYATYSQNCFMLAQKLFSALSATLHSSRADHASAGAEGAAHESIHPPRIDVLELSQHRGGFTLEALLGDSEDVDEQATKKEEGHTEPPTPSRTYALVIFLVSTFTDGAAPPRSQTFEQLLRDAYEDHRVARNTLAKTHFALFGLGDMAYGPHHFNAFAKHLHLWCRGLGAPAFVVPPVYATESRSMSLFHIFLTTLLRWLQHVEYAADGTLRVCRRSRVVVAARHKASQSHRGTRKSAPATEDAKGHVANSADGLSPPTKKNSHVDVHAEVYDAHGNDASISGHAHKETCNNNHHHRSSSSSSSSRRLRPHDDSERESDGDEDAKSEEKEEELEDVEDVVWDGAQEDSAWVADMTRGAVDHHTLPELLYPKLEQSLTKQGYRLLGSHSAVKLCRWTKSMLRGRGGCYKHTFYNINSSQCMEMTPSLACANKCVFCWRHHTNPVSRAFRWRQDPPEFLIARAMEEHRAMIKQMRGVPGVTPERLAEAMRIRHCALSLVGEPIMYPQINRFCDLLHEHHISSFMVTNAQFPDQLRDLQPVVQLYLSIDAPTPEELKKIDRPLFEDYWERCVACVQELRRKRQRTVFRLTLVNQYNNANIAAYADLVQMGWPDFIEVKGVTYCGTSATSTLTMKEHVPRHTEVIRFCHALCAHMAQRSPPHPRATCDERGGDGSRRAARAAVLPGSMNAAECAASHKHVVDIDARDEDENKQVVDGDINASLCLDASAEEQLSWPYRIACEHEHSCCVLIALDKFYINGRWHTWIDYDKFFELADQGNHDFTSLDYALVTPDWATYNSQERGFDPAHTRMQGKKPRPA